MHTGRGRRKCVPKIFIRVLSLRSSWFTRYGPHPWKIPCAAAIAATSPPTVVVVSPPTVALSPTTFVSAANIVVTTTYHPRSPALQLHRSTHRKFHPVASRCCSFDSRIIARPPTSETRHPTVDYPPTTIIIRLPVVLFLLRAISIGPTKPPPELLPSSPRL